MLFSSPGLILERLTSQLRRHNVARLAPSTLSIMPSSSPFLSSETFVPSPPLARWAMTPPFGWPPTYPEAQSRIPRHVLWLFICFAASARLRRMSLSNSHKSPSVPLLSV